jgi:hypothetical protein
VARLIVRYPRERTVRIDRWARGKTNQELEIAPGRHVVDLGVPRDYAPEEQECYVRGSAESPATLEFRPARFSPLYCRYNGFMLGQFLSLAAAKDLEKDYEQNVDRIQEFLNEHGIALRFPPEPPALADNKHLQLLEDVLSGGDFPKELRDFAMVATHLVCFSYLGGDDRERSASEILRLSKKHMIPKEFADGYFDRFPAGSAPKFSRVLSASLAWLTRAVDQLEVEPDTAFVIMPFSDPYAARFVKLYRAGLEENELRAFRAWGGLSGEEYCGLLLGLIGKSGLVMADLSECNPNVLYEVGAAHALGKVAVLIVDEHFADSIPSNIGHDAVIKYSPDEEDWPQSAVRLLALMAGSARVAADRGKRTRIGPDQMEEALDSAADLIRGWIEARAPDEDRDDPKRSDPTMPDD